MKDAKFSISNPYMFNIFSDCLTQIKIVKLSRPNFLKIISLLIFTLFNFLFKKFSVNKREIPLIKKNVDTMSGSVESCPGSEVLGGIFFWYVLSEIIKTHVMSQLFSRENINVEMTSISLLASFYPDHFSILFKHNSVFHKMDMDTHTGSVEAN